MLSADQALLASFKWSRLATVSVQGVWHSTGLGWIQGSQRVQRKWPHFTWVPVCLLELGLPCDMWLQRWVTHSAEINRQHQTAEVREMSWIFHQTHWRYTTVVASSGFQRLFKVSSCLVEATEVVFSFSSWSRGPLKPTLDMGVRLLFCTLYPALYSRTGWPPWIWVWSSHNLYENTCCI